MTVVNMAANAALYTLRTGVAVAGGVATPAQTVFLSIVGAIGGIGYMYHKGSQAYNEEVDRRVTLRLQANGGANQNGPAQAPPAPVAVPLNGVLAPNQPQAAPAPALGENPQQAKRNVERNMNTAGFTKFYYMSTEGRKALTENVLTPALKKTGTLAKESLRMGLWATVALVDNTVGRCFPSARSVANKVTPNAIQEFYRNENSLHTSLREKAGHDRDLTSLISKQAFGKGVSDKDIMNNLFLLLSVSTSVGNRELSDFIMQYASAKRATWINETTQLKTRIAQLKRAKQPTVIEEARRKEIVELDSIRRLMEGLYANRPLREANISPRSPEFIRLAQNVLTSDFSFRAKVNFLKRLEGLGVDLRALNKTDILIKVFEKGDLALFMHLCDTRGLDLNKRHKVSIQQNGKQEDTEISTIRYVFSHLRRNEFINYLLQSSVDLRDLNNTDLLLRVIDKGDLNLLKRLCEEKKLSLNKRHERTLMIDGKETKTRVSALHYALYHAKKVFVGYVLDHGGDLKKVPQKRHLLTMQDIKSTKWLFDKGREEAQRRRQSTRNYDSIVLEISRRGLEGKFNNAWFA